MLALIIIFERMSGAGRRSQYRKGVTSQYESDEMDLSNGDEIGLVIANRGAHIFTVKLSSTGQEAAAKLPSKLHKVIWVKPRDYVVVETAGTGGEGEGVLSIKQILSKDNIKSLKKSGQWPSTFDSEEEISKGRGAKGGAVVMDDLMPGYEYQEEEEEYEEEGAEDPVA